MHEGPHPFTFRFTFRAAEPCVYAPEAEMSPGPWPQPDVLRIQQSRCNPTAAEINGAGEGPTRKDDVQLYHWRGAVWRSVQEKTVETSEIREDYRMSVLSRL